MKNLILIGMIAILGMCGCADKKLSSSSEFTLIEAYQQGFVRGKQNPNGMNGGTNYVIILKKKKEFQILDCWLGEINFDYETRDRENEFRLVFTDFTDYKKNQNLEKKKPFDYDGKVLIKYQVDNKVKYFIVKEFEVRVKSVGV